MGYNVALFCNFRCIGVDEEGIVKSCWKDFGLSFNVTLASGKTFLVETNLKLELHTYTQRFGCFNIQTIEITKQPTRMCMCHNKY